MSLPDEVKKEIVHLSHKGDHEALILYLKEKLKSSDVLPADILVYARGTIFSSRPGKPYVIDAAMINKIGVIVSGLADEHKASSAQFYHLAAERGSSWGNRNYARLLLYGNHGVKKSAKDALEYAQKAVELEPDKTKAQHKFVLCQMHRANKQWQEANIALAAYLSFIEREIGSAKNNRKKLLQTDIEAVSKYIIKNIISEFEADLDPDCEEITSERCRDDLAEIDILISCRVSLPEFLSIKQQLYYLQGQFYEKLGELSNAWHAYCKVDDKKSVSYGNAIAARANLLKQEVRRRLNLLSHDLPQAVPMKEDELPASEVTVETNADLLLPGDIPLPLKFRQKWKKEAVWFDSVDTEALDTELKERQEKLELMLKAKTAELSVVEELLEDDAESAVLISKKEILEEERKLLKNVRAKLKDEYKKHSASHRQVFRRHTAESHFFNPIRTSEKVRLVKLVESIIDHRFRENDEGLVSIDLMGISGRLLITAERVFQETIVSLSGDKEPALGIPIAREKPWAVSGYCYSRSGVTTYGPVERYKVGATEMESEHRVAPKRQRLGDSYLPQHGTYSQSIYPFLLKLCVCEVSKEKQLASWMLRYGRLHLSVTLEELQEVYGEATEDDVHQFNRICFLVMTKEQSQWHAATDPDFQLGMTVSLARCLIMIEAGHISFSEALINTALFSVYSHTGLADSCSKVDDSARYIDTMYCAYLQQKHGDDHVAFFKKYVKAGKPMTTVLTREQARSDMQYAYGGEDDTDGEGYASDMTP